MRSSSIFQWRLSERVIGCAGFQHVCHGAATVVSMKRVLYGFVFSSFATLRRS